MRSTFRPRRAIDPTEHRGDDRWPPAFYCVAKIGGAPAASNPSIRRSLIGEHGGTSSRRPGARGTPAAPARPKPWSTRQPGARGRCRFPSVHHRGSSITIILARMFLAAADEEHVQREARIRSPKPGGIAATAGAAALGVARASSAAAAAPVPAQRRRVRPTWMESSAPACTGTAARQDQGRRTLRTRLRGARDWVRAVEALDHRLGGGKVVEVGGQWIADQEDLRENGNAKEFGASGSSRTPGADDLPVPRTAARRARTTARSTRFTGRHGRRRAGERCILQNEHVSARPYRWSTSTPRTPWTRRRQRRDVRAPPPQPARRADASSTFGSVRVGLRAAGRVPASSSSTPTLPDPDPRTAPWRAGGGAQDGFWRREFVSIRLHEDARQARAAVSAGAPDHTARRRRHGLHRPAYGQGQDGDRHGPSVADRADPLRARPPRAACPVAQRFPQGSAIKVEAVYSPPVLA